MSKCQWCKEIDYRPIQGGTAQYRVKFTHWNKTVIQNVCSKCLKYVKEYFIVDWVRKIKSQKEGKVKK